MNVLTVIHNIASYIHMAWQFQLNLYINIFGVMIRQNHQLIVENRNEYHKLPSKKGPVT